MLFHLWYPVKEIIEQLKGAKITLIGTATTVDEAIANEHAGMDIVVAQGSEAVDIGVIFNNQQSA